MNIPVNYVPSLAFQIEIKGIIDKAARPEKERQCPVCGSWIGQRESCCDETDNPREFIPVTDNEIDWNRGEGLF